jgi:hypothetical protein
MLLSGLLKDYVKNNYCLSFIANIQLFTDM